MSGWTIKRTDTFLRFIKKHKKNNQLLLELDKKIKKLKEDPNKVGGSLSGRLHRNKSTRLIRKYRLIFRVDKKSETIYLIAIDHRRKAYK